MLSHQHADGWGIAFRDHRSHWTVHRSLERAADDADFHQLASNSSGDVLVVHVRQKTRGVVAIENTHPFVSAPWVFTHNGTVSEVGYLDAEISPERRASIQGDTDSERLFAFIMTRLDQALPKWPAPRVRIDHAIRAVTRELEQLADFGTASFLLSDGGVLYAHRQGAPLHLLERRASSDNTHCASIPCVAITTEPITDEDWVEFEDGDLVRVSRGTVPSWARL